MCYIATQSLARARVAALKRTSALDVFWTVTFCELSLCCSLHAGRRRGEPRSSFTNDWRKNVSVADRLPICGRRAHMCVYTHMHASAGRKAACLVQRHRSLAFQLVVWWLRKNWELWIPLNEGSRALDSLASEPSSAPWKPSMGAEHVPTRIYLFACLSHTLHCKFTFVRGFCLFCSLLYHLGQKHALAHTKPSIYIYWIEWMPTINSNPREGPSASAITDLTLVSDKVRDLSDRLIRFRYSLPSRVVITCILNSV